jgi:hypothetical protein
MVKGRPQNSMNCGGIDGIQQLLGLLADSSRHCPWILFSPTDEGMEYGSLNDSINYVLRTQGKTGDLRKNGA